MTYDFSKFNTSDLYDFLAEITLRYNYILQHGGTHDEITRLAECLKLIQDEIRKRKK